MKKNYSKASLFAMISLVLVSCLDITEIPFVDLQARFLPSSNVIQLGTSITFNQQSTTVASRFMWDFGDGSTSTEESPIYNYDSTGRFTVKLVTTKADGITKDSTTQEILVIPDTDSVSNFHTFGEAVSEEFGFSFARLPDGYLLAGRKNLNGLLLFRTDNNMTTLWTKEINNIASGRGQIFVSDVRQTVDGGFILCGFYDYNINDKDAYIIKLDQNGNEQWTSFFKTQTNEEFNRVLEVNGIFLVIGTISDISSTGTSTPSLLIVSYDNSGTQTDLTIDGSNWTANDFVFTFDGGFAIAVTEGDRPRIFKFNPEFEELEKYVPLINNQPFEGKALGITQSSNGDLILVGELTYEDELGNPSDSSNAFIASFDEFGVFQWVDLRAYYNESYEDVVETTDGSFVAVGTHENPLSGRDVLVGRYSPDGANMQVKLIGDSQDDEGFTVKPEPNGDVSIIGTTRSFGSGLRDFYYLRLNSMLE